MKGRVISRMQSYDITPTPAELATVFCAMDADEQAAFLNCIANITADWKTPFVFQLQAIIDSPVLSAQGRSVMQEIGEYGAAAVAPCCAGKNCTELAEKCGHAAAQAGCSPAGAYLAVKTPDFFDEGLQAFMDGSDLRDCPYDEGADGQNGWRKGWYHGAGVDEQGRRDS